MPSLAIIRNGLKGLVDSNPKRDGAGIVTGYGGSTPAENPSIPPGSSAAANTVVYLGVGLGVGCAVLIGLIVVAILIIRKRREHNRMIQAIQVEGNLQLPQRQQVQEMPRTLSMMRRDTLIQSQERAGWNALASDESVNEPEPIRRADRRKRASVSLPKKLRRRGIPLKRLKRLTAILESPRSRNSPALPSLPATDPMPTTVDVVQLAVPPPLRRVYNLSCADDEDDVFVCPESPKPEVLPSFALRSPGRYGAGIANNDTRAYRSRSLDFMPAIPNDAIFGWSSRPVRLPMHARSFSLGAPPGRPPSGPVPPLPVIKPHDEQNQSVARRGVRISRISSSSTGSTGSSGLIATPLLVIPEKNQPIESPSLEDVVARDDNASLKNVATNQWQNPLIVGPRQVNSAPTKQGTGRLNNHTSIRSNIVRYSTESLASHRTSLPSIESSESLLNQPCLAQTGLPNQTNVSRISSENSLQNYRIAKKATTPRKASRTSVSENGSPLERIKTGVLRDISGNSNVPSRQPSNATETSSRSSNGNPFQWDQPLTKPSALKGSPNARKGHRRQNCVRISTLTPQVLGPPPSRSTSPSIMHGIEEEPDSDEAVQQSGVRFVTNHRLSRISNTSSSNLAIRVRTSLTPSSPTLSVWTALQEHGLPSQASDSQLSYSAGTRPASRQSYCSSMHSIPAFPSPVKAAVSTIQLSQPIPDVYLSRPSTDIEEDENASPFALALDSGSDLSSSPPVVASNFVEYDPTHPAWPITTIAAKEYDPASPVWNENEQESSSAFFPFAAQNVDEQVSPRSRPVSYGGDLPDTTPVSPKSMPAGFQDFFDKKETGSKPARALEKLTSANASAVMAQMSPKVDFPGAPILAPPEEDQAYATITFKSTGSLLRKASDTAYFIPMRSPPQPPSPTKASCVPSPLHITCKTSPVGPRSQPAQSVLKNAMVLRRMNSEVNTITDRESKRFVRLGREASPLLPWIGVAEPNESCADMDEVFDFDFAADSKSGAEEQASWNMEEADISEAGRNLDGVMGGFGPVRSGERNPENRSPSVWNDGEKYWEQGRSTPIGFATSSPPASRGTPMEQFVDNSRSLQNTPKSFYDSDGFLKS